MTASAKAGITVLVTDGAERSSLAIVRALGIAGYDVVVTSSNGRSLAGASRYARVDVPVPDSLAEPEALAEALLRLSQSSAAAVVIPVTEPSLLAVLPVRDRFAAAIPFASLEAFRRISDKEAVLSAAKDVGIAVPHQVVVRHVDALEEVAPALDYPVVVKTASSVVEHGGRRFKHGVHHARNPAEALHAARLLGPGAYPMLIQQRIVGPGIGVFLLLWKGAEIARFAHRRLREKPPSGGISVYRESISVREELVATSRALVDRFDWEGVAMVEYKIDAATGTPYLMEINGRFWGSLQLAIDAGVDFPRLLVECAIAKSSPAPVREYREGVRSRWWWGDVDALLARVTRSDEALALPSGAPSRLRAVADFMTLWRPGDRNEVLRMRDPAPFLRETLNWLRRR